MGQGGLQSATGSQQLITVGNYVDPQVESLSRSDGILDH